MQLLLPTLPMTNIHLMEIVEEKMMEMMEMRQEVGILVHEVGMLVQQVGMFMLEVGMLMQVILIKIVVDNLEEQVKMLKIL